jgi:hypothetical protein
MLKRNAEAFRFPEVYCYAYVDNSDGKACVVYV